MWDARRLGKKVKSSLSSKKPLPGSYKAGRLGGYKAEILKS
jgi:hypothetical protein